MKIRCFVFLFAIVVISGCTPKLKMGVNTHTAKIDLSNESLVLLSLHLQNQHVSYYRPEAILLHVEVLQGNEAKEKISYRFDREGGGASGQWNKYFVRAMLKPGEYVIRGVSGQSKKFPITGNFFMPLHSSINVPPSSIIYLGRIVGTVRERRDNEFRAGSLIPLVDQATTGFSTGTFDITIVDAFDDDMRTMKVVFPVLRHQKEIKQQLLPAFDREFAQQWWEDH